jgi:[CysO sulfur-carrier protein]-S-L-cysteine hydrolase
VIDAARAALPNESIGLLVGPAYAAEGGVPTRYVGLDNAALSPYRYELADDVLAERVTELEAASDVIWAIAHSHVASPAVPSSADVAQAYYPDSLYLICSLAEPVPETRAWSIRDGEVSEVTLSVG